MSEVFVMDSSAPLAKSNLATVHGFILLASILALVYLFLQIWQLISVSNRHRIGDGQRVETYGFDLSNCRIPRDEIQAAGMPKDGIPVLDDPGYLTPDEVEAVNQQGRGKYLVSSDLVIGISLHGQSRAYPLRVLNWHEIVNDQLGNVPIAVTYNPLCDSAVVYDRRAGDERLTLGVSGLVYNSNTLFYDRREDASNESLWIQLLGKAVTGPASLKSQQLQPLSCDLVSWRVWLDRNPQTTVLAPEPEKMKLYNSQYGNYFGSDDLRFPVKPLPPENGIAKKTPVLILTVNGQMYVFSYDSIVKNKNELGEWNTDVSGIPIGLTAFKNPLCVIARSRDPHVLICSRYSFWFAWYAMNPGML